MLNIKSGDAHLYKALKNKDLKEIDSNYTKMLDALIRIALAFDYPESDLIKLVEKATGKIWKEIKENWI